MTVAELGARMSSAEFTEWLAYAELEPFGPRREDLRAALLASIVTNANGGRKGKAVAPDEFLDLADPVDVPSDADQVTVKARAFFDGLMRGPKDKIH